MTSPFSILAVLAVPALLAFTWWRKAPLVQGIVLANFLVFILMLVAGLVEGARFGTIAGSPFLEDLAFRPSDGWTSFWRILTTTFLHADVLHVVGNMLILMMVGLPFEERVGRERFLVIYVLSAIVAVVLHIGWILATQGESSLSIPVVGASGAVFGILGAFATGYPHDKIPMWLLFIILPRVPVIVAALVLVLVEFLILAGGARSGVATAAHLGGALGGALFMLALRPEPRAGSRAGRAGPLDLAALDRRVEDPRQKTIVQRLRENVDQPETRRAWFEKLGRSLTCRECGQPFVEAEEPRFRCPAGHEESYRAS